MKEFKNEFSWSVTRDDIFRKCHRMYYFQYYGFWGGWEIEADNRTRMTYILKQLQNRQMWAGKKVHDCIENVIIEIREGIKKIDISQKIDSTLDQMRKEFLNSKNKNYLSDPKSCALFEHEYDLLVPETEWKSNADNVVECLKAFFDSEVYKEILQLKENQWLEIEEFPYFLLNDEKIYAVLDFAFSRNDKIIIYDWKTGKENVERDRFQLACYGLFAIQEWEIQPEKVKLIDFFLSNGQQYDYNLKDFNINQIKEDIVNSIAEMKDILDDPQENIAKEDLFSFTDNEQTCKYCNYYKVCPKYT